MPPAVRCPICRWSSRQPTADPWCPKCGGPVEPADPAAHPGGPTAVLVGLAVVGPCGIPLGWLAAAAGRDPVFSPAVAVAVAAATAGVALGVAAARGPHRLRVGGVLAVLAVGHLTAAGLFAVKPEWGEQVRRGWGRPPTDWQPFDPGPAAGFTVQFPGPAEPRPSPLPDWRLTGFATAGDWRGSADRFEAAHGPAPAGPADAAAWFGRARQAVVAAAGGTLLSEAEVFPPDRPPGFQARQYWVGLPDRVTRRVVRVYRGGGRTFYLAAEGPFFRPDSKDVAAFFRSFRVGD